MGKMKRQITKEQFTEQNYEDDKKHSSTSRS